MDYLFVIFFATAITLSFIPLFGNHKEEHMVRNILCPIISICCLIIANFFK